MLVRSTSSTLHSCMRLYGIQHGGQQVEPSALPSIVVDFTPSSRQSVALARTRGSEVTTSLHVFRATLWHSLHESFSLLSPTVILLSPSVSVIRSTGYP